MSNWIKAFTNVTSINPNSTKRKRAAFYGQKLEQLPQLQLLSVANSAVSTVASGLETANEDAAEASAGNAATEIVSFSQAESLAALTPAAQPGAVVANDGIMTVNHSSKTVTIDVSKEKFGDGTRKFYVAGGGSGWQVKLTGLNTNSNWTKDWYKNGKSVSGDSLTKSVNMGLGTNKISAKIKNKNTKAERHAIVWFYSYPDLAVASSAGTTNVAFGQPALGSIAVHNSGSQTASGGVLDLDVEGSRMSIPFGPIGASGVRNVSFNIPSSMISESGQHLVDYSVRMTSGTELDADSNFELHDADSVTTLFSNNEGSFTVNVALPPDVQAPTAELEFDETIDGKPIHEGYVIPVLFEDDRGVNTATIGAGDVVAVRPNGQRVSLGYQGAALLTSDATEAKAYFTLSAPAGGWKPSDSGTWLVELVGSIKDQAGNEIRRGLIGELDVEVLDEIAPRVRDVVVSDINSKEHGDHFVDVVYEDETALDVSSLDDDDIRVYSESDESLELDIEKAGEPEAIVPGRKYRMRYRIVEPEEGWNRNFNGTWLVDLNADSVNDAEDNSASSGYLADFTINVPNSAPQVIGQVEVTVDADATEVRIAYDDLLDESVVVDHDGDELHYVSVGTDPVHGSAHDNRDSDEIVYQLTDLSFAGTDGFTATVSDGQDVAQIQIVVVVEADVTAPEIEVNPSDSLITESTPGSVHEFTVIVSDDRGIDFDLVGDNDFVVVGPNGTQLPVVLEEVAEPAIDATEFELRYSFTSPGTGWTFRDNGEWKIKLQPNHLTDVAGNAPILEETTFEVEIVDAEIPAAQLVSAEQVSGFGTGTYEIVVEYTDNVDVDRASIDVDDIQVVRSDGVVELQVTGVRIENLSSGRGFRAIYQVTASEDAGFTWRDNGEYEIRLLDSEIEDISGNGNSSVMLGSMIVAVENQSASGVTDTFTFDEGQEYESGQSVLDNDIDLDNEPEELSAQVLQQTQHGVVELTADGFVKYTPNEDGFVGTDQFLYAISDGNSVSEAVLVRLTVNRVRPQVAADAYSISADSTLRLRSDEGVLANDQDPLGGTLSAELVEPPAHGTLQSFGEDGSFRYKPNPGFSGTDTFSYRALNGVHASDVVTVSIQVGDSSTPPVGSVAELSVKFFGVGDRANEELKYLVPGQQFRALFFATDLRDEPLGIFGGHLDVRYDSEIARFSQDSTTIHFSESAGGTIKQDEGLFDEIGGFSSNAAADNRSQLMFEVVGTAIESGVLNFTATPGDDVFSEFLVKGFDDDIADRVATASNSIRVIGPLAMSIDQAAISENGGVAKGTVTRPSGDSSEDLLVTLTVDSEDVTVEKTVVIPSGKQSASFTIEAVENHRLDGTRPVTITADAEGWLSMSASLDITDHEELSLSADQVVVVENAGEKAVRLTVRRSNVDDLSRDLTVSLTSSRNAQDDELNFPEHVVIPAGQDSVTIDIDAVDDKLLDGTQLIDIMASADGYAADSVGISVLDHETIDLELLAREISEEGGSLTAVVSRSDTDDLSQDVWVTITSDRPDLIAHNDAVLIRAGESSASISIDIPAGDLVDGDTEVKFTVTANEFEGDSDSIVIRDASTDVVVSRFDVLNDRVDDGNATIELTITNQGTGTAKNFEVAIVHSDDEIIGNDDDRVVGTVIVERLAAGESQTVTTNVTLDRQLLVQRALAEDTVNPTRGTKSSMVDYLSAVVDPTNKLQEENGDGSAEANNSGRGLRIDMDDVTALPFDLNGDGLVKGSDAVFVINRVKTFANGETQHADLNFDGKITGSDAIKIINRIGYMLNDSVIENPSSEAIVIVEPVESSPVEPPMPGQPGSGDGQKQVSGVASRPSEQLLGAVKDDLAQRMRVGTSTIEVVEVDAVDWPDSGLGVPSNEPALTVITPGFRMTLSVAGRSTRYTYHTDARDEFVFATQQSGTVEDRRYRSIPTGGTINRLGRLRATASTPTERAIDGVFEDDIHQLMNELS